MVREFYNVDYKKTPDYNKDAIDKRTTLYWNLKAKFDDKGEIKVRFFNSDLSQKYKIVVQGLDQKGRMVYTEEFVQ